MRDVCVCGLEGFLAEVYPLSQDPNFTRQSPQDPLPHPLNDLSGNRLCLSEGLGSEGVQGHQTKSAVTCCQDV